MAITYENVIFDFVLDPLRDLLIAEYDYGNIYISPKIESQEPFNIRLWSNDSETNQYFATAWQKQYNIEIVLYEIYPNPNEVFYKQFYNDIERIYQLLFDNAKHNSTTSSVSGNNRGSVTHKWIDGVCEDFIINDLTDEEEGIEGLNSCKFTFNCKISRES